MTRVKLRALKLVLLLAFMCPMLKGDVGDDLEEKKKT